MIKENNPPGPHSQQACSLRESLGLPKYATVGTVNVLINVIDCDQMSEMFCMINAAMERGEGYGVDEFHSESDFFCDINGGPCFSVVDSNSGKMVAGFALAHSKYYRGSGIQAVDPVIIVKKCMRGQGFGEFAFQTCLQFAKKLNYTGVYADTFVNNAAMMRIIEKRPAFNKVGTLPLGGRMPDGTVVGMNLYFMDLIADGASV